MNEPAIITGVMPLEARLQGAWRFSGTMLEWCKGRGKVVIIVHDNPDPDCLASALALRYLFMVKNGEEPLIAFSGMIGRSENLIMARLLDIPLTPLEIINLNEYGVICMLDTQPGTGNNSLDAALKVDVVIDHHPLREETKVCCWVDVREDYGVTATILYEYLVAHKIEIDAKLATAIFYAIKSDTQDLGREADLPDREAYLQLFPIVDKQLLYQITNPRQPVEYFRTVRRTLDSARIYGTAIVVDLQKVDYPELVAEMADILLKLEGADAVLVYGEYVSELLLSVRTSSADMNAGGTMKSLVMGLGCGGGHSFMGGGKIPAQSGASEGFISVKKTLEERFRQLTGTIEQNPQKIEIEVIDEKQRQKS